MGIILREWKKIKGHLVPSITIQINERMECETGKATESAKEWGNYLEDVAAEWAPDKGSGPSAKRDRSNKPLKCKQTIRTLCGDRRR